MTDRIDRDWIANYLPDRKFVSEYANPNFWLSGGFEKFSTNTVKFIPLHHDIVTWIWNLSHITRVPEQSFVQEMCALTAVPKNPTPRELMEHAGTRPREMFHMKGVVADCAEKNPDDPYYLSPEVRAKMVDFAKDTPFLVDQLKAEAWSDFRTFDGKNATAQELRRYGKIPGVDFQYWEKYFPTMIDVLYENVEREDGRVVGYKIRDFSPEYKTLKNLD